MMEINKNKPLLSICIPTYNRAHLLKVMLKVLLPQVREFENDVEVIVSDNASTDDTLFVIKGSKKLGPFKYYTHTSNIGAVANFIKCTTELATGKYVWLLGDHNLMQPNGIKDLLKILKENKDFKIFYSNFKCATYPKHWPDKSLKDVAENYDTIAWNNTHSKIFKHWFELINSNTAFCTQSYVHIIERKVWVNFWKNKRIPQTFSSAIGTYPHTYMIAQTLFKEKAYFIGQPLIMIFNGAQHWNDLLNKCKVYIFGFSELTSLYKKKGISKQVWLLAKNWCYTQTLNNYSEFIRAGNNFTISFYLKNIFRPYIIKAMILGYLKANTTMISRLTNKSTYVISRLYKYAFFNCRPARIIHKYLNNV